MHSQNNFEQLVNSVPPTSIPIPTSATYNPAELCSILEQALPNTLYKYFNTGLNYYKNSDTDAAFITNIVFLFSQYIKNSLKEGDINADQQVTIEKCLDLALSNIEQNLKFFDYNISLLNSKKNIFDARKLSLIIIGYAIKYIKKTN